MKNSEYWQERFKQMEEAEHDTSVQKVQEIQEQFERALAAINGKINAWYQRLANNNGVSMQEARKLLDQKELKEFHWNVEDYIKYAEENAISGAWEKQLENASVRVHISRLEALKIDTQQEMEKLYGNCIDAVDNHISNLYTSDFYHTAYEVQKGIGIGTSMNRLDPNMVEKIVRKPWAVDGKNFSDRLWENKTKLINNVHNSLTRMCITGESPDRAINEIAGQMKVSKAQAGRVVMTESAAFANQAREDAMKELDVEQFEVVETLDSHTCELCGSMDGKHFPMSEYQIGVTVPPFHPNCYDNKTEVLTNNGWKLFADLKKEDLVYTVNPDTMIPEWQKPIRYISYPYEGNMLYFHNDRTDIMVTPHHNMLVQNMDSNVKDKSFKLKRADTIGVKAKNRMTGGCSWNGKKKTHTLLAGREVDIEIYLRFMAYWLADGSCTKRDGERYEIKIAQCDNQWMADSLRTLPFKLHIYKESIEIYDTSLGKYLEQFGKCTEKYIPDDIKEISSELITIFLNAYSKTDGSMKKGKHWKGYQFKDSITFFTTSKQLAADLGELIMKAGGRPSYKLDQSAGKEVAFRNGTYKINYDCWRVNWNVQPYSWICYMDVEKVKYANLVYCVEVEKYNTLLVRRKGKVIWSGNCRGCTCPYFDDEIESVGERIARDENGENYYVPTDTTYKEWKKSFVDGDIDHTSNSFKPRQEAEKEWKHVKFKTETENMQEYIDKKRERKFFGLPVDETASWIGKDNKICKVEDLREYFVNGETFKVDGKKVVLDYSQHEKEIANIIAKETGKDIKMVPRITFPQNIQTPDYLIDGIKFDLKTPPGNGKNTLYGMVKSKKRQANNFVICADKTALSIDEIEQQIQGIYTSKNTSFVDTIILVKNEEIVKIYKRNK